MNQIDPTHAIVLVGILILLLIIMTMRASYWCGVATEKDQRIKDADQHTRNAQQMASKMEEYFDTERNHNGELQERLIETIVGKKEAKP